MPNRPPSFDPRKFGARPAPSSSTAAGGRLSANDRGYTARWQRASRVFLVANPTCEHCTLAGLATPATCVDHRDPHRGDPRKFWDQANWSPLCKPCHDKKTAAGQ